MASALKWFAFRILRMVKFWIRVLGVELGLPLVGSPLALEDGLMVDSGREEGGEGETGVCSACPEGAAVVLYGDQVGGGEGKGVMGRV